MLVRQVLRRLPVINLQKTCPCLRPYTQKIEFETFDKEDEREISEERKKRQLWLKFREPNISEEYIQNLSPEIKGFFKINKKNSCFAYLDFESEKVAEEHYEKFIEEGILVEFCGDKMGRERYKDREFQIAEKRKRQLLLKFSQPDISEEYITILSPEIKGINIVRKQNSCHAYIQFESKEIVDQHYEKFKEDGMSVDYCGKKNISSEERKKKQLRMEFSQPDISEEYIRNLSPEIKGIKIIRKQDSCHAYIQFESEEIVDQHYEKFKEDGMSVDYCGKKIISSEERKKQQLRMEFSQPDISEEYIRNLSPEIKGINIIRKQDSCHAYIQFESEEIVDQHYEKFKEEGMSVDYCGKKDISSEERKKQQLRMEFSQPDISEEYIRNLSPEIKGINIIRKQDSCHAYIQFESEEIVDQHYEKFKEDGMSVDYCGKKIISSEERKKQQLRMEFSQPDISEEYIRNLSPEIKGINIIRKQDSCHAYIQFESEEIVDQHYEKFKEDGMSVDYCGKKDISSEERKKLQLLMKFSQPDISKEYIRNLSPEIKGIIIVRKQDSCHAYIQFESEEIVDQHYEKFKEDGMSVDYCSKKDESSGERKKQQLRMEFSQPDISREYIRNLSPEIKGIIVIRKQDSCHAYIQFESEEIVDQHYEKFKEEGMSVDYCGKKGENSGERKKKQLRMKFSQPDISEEYIRNLSPEIKGIKLIREQDSCHAYIDFESEEIADKHFEKFNEEGILVEFCGRKLFRQKYALKNAEDFEERKKLQLLMKFSQPNISKKYIRNLSPEIKGIHLIREQDSCHAYVEFESEEIAEEHYKKFKEDKIWVDFCGQKSQTIESPEERNKLELMLKFSQPYISEEYIQNLSPEIKRIKLDRYKQTCNAYVEFESEEIAEEHYKKFKEDKIWVDFCGQKRQNIGSSNDKKRCQLWLKFSTPDISKEYIQNLSPEIKGISIVRNKKSSFVYVDFESEEIAEEHYEKFDEDGIWVDFCGKKMGKKKKPFLKYQRGDLIYLDPKADKKLRLMFKNEVEEDDIYMLSDDIKNVTIRYGENQCKVLVEFETAELADKNYKWFQVLSIDEMPVQVFRCTAGLKSDKTDSKVLLVKDVGETETIEDLMNDFQGAEEGHIFFSLYNQKWARLEFPDHETCISAMRNYGIGRKVALHIERTNKVEREVDYKKLSLRVKNWETKQQLYEMFPHATNIRFNVRLEKKNSFLRKNAIIDFDDEEHARDSYHEFGAQGVQYAYYAEYDYKILVMNQISEWDDERSMLDLFPAASRVFIHRTDSDCGNMTLRNAFFIFDNEEDAREALESNSHRRLWYRVIRD